MMENTKPTYRPGSNLEKMRLAMSEALKISNEVDSPIPDKITARMCISKIRVAHFPDKNFYSRVHPDGRLLIGLWPS